MPLVFTATTPQGVVLVNAFVEIEVTRRKANVRQLSRRPRSYMRSNGVSVRRPRIVANCGAEPISVRRSWGEIFAVLIVCVANPVRIRTTGRMYCLAGEKIDAANPNAPPI